MEVKIETPRGTITVVETYIMSDNDLMLIEDYFLNDELVRTIVEYFCSDTYVLACYL